MKAFVIPLGPCHVPSSAMAHTRGRHMGPCPSLTKSLGPSERGEEALLLHEGHFGGVSGHFEAWMDHWRRTGALWLIWAFRSVISFDGGWGLFGVVKGLL